MMKNKSSIDFVGVGAEKAATTWLADCLREHPEIFIPKQKELFFFNEYDPHYLEVKNYKYSRGIGWYKGFFESADKSQIKGEISPTYLYCKGAVKRIKKHFPKAKILVILRDPVERAHSQYIDDLRRGLIKKISFDEAFKKYKGYKIKSTYAKGIKNYFGAFSKKNVLVLILDDIKEYSSREIKKVYKFLGVNDVNFKPASLDKKPNRAGKARFYWLNSFMMSVEYFMGRKRLNWIHNRLEALGVKRLALKVQELNSSRENVHSELNASTKVRLRKYFSEDIKETEKLIGRKLDMWK